MALSEKDIHIGRFFQQSKSRAQNKNVPFTVTLKYLRDTAVDYCPVFGHKFVWGRSHLGKGKTTGDSPSLDRIIPELGYVPGNVVFISHNANRIKNNATEKELYAVADWLHEARKNVKQKSAAPVSTGSDPQGEVYLELGTISAAGTREDYYDLDHYQRTVRGEDSDYRTQTRGGDSVGARDKEMEPLIVAQSIEATWPREPEIIWVKDRGGHIPD